MPQISVYTMTGEVKEKIEADPKIFAVKMNYPLVQQVVTALASGRRKNLAHAKTRGEVRGGGKKPWRQKGTGRARQGSIRSPQWKGGGVVWGPRNTTVYTLAINKTMKKNALLMALSERVRENNCAIIDELTFNEPKTKLMAKCLKDLAKELPVQKGVLWVRSAKVDNLLARVTRNIVRTRVVEANNLGLEEILKYPVLLFTRAGYEEVTKKLTKV